MLDGHFGRVYSSYILIGNIAAGGLEKCMRHFFGISESAVKLGNYSFRNSSEIYCFVIKFFYKNLRINLEFSFITGAVGNSRVLLLETAFDNIRYLLS